jgi:tetratricopeptide (TPR) repeat protein
MTRDTWFDATSIGRRIQQARAGRSQRQLGEQLGYLQPHISRYERGLVPDSFRFLAGLSSVLGVDVNWVLTGRAAADPADSSRDLSQSGLTEAVRRAVSDVLHEAGLGDPPIDRAQELLVSLEPSLSLWDRLTLELPLLLLPLLASGPAGHRQDAQPAGNRAGSPDQPTSRSPAAETEPRPEVVLEEVRRASRAGDSERALDTLAGAAELLEAKAPSIVTHERVRFLLIWAWLVAESRDASAIDADPRPARLLFQLARATRKTGRLDEAERLYRTGLDRAKRAGDDAVAARCHAGLGHLYFERGEFEAARSEYVKVLETALRLGSPELLFFAYLDLAMYYHEHEHAYGKAAEYAAAGLDIARREEDREHTGLFLNELGLNAMELGDMAQAEANFAETLLVAEELGSPRMLAIARINLGELRLRSGDLEGATSLLREGRSAAADVGLVWAECQAEILLARCDHARGWTATALERVEKVEDRCLANGLEHERELARALEHEIRQGMLSKLSALTA